MKKVFEEAKVEKILVSVADVLTASGDVAGDFNTVGDKGQGWDDIGGNKA